LRGRGERSSALDAILRRQIPERTVAKVSRFIAFSSCYDEANKTAPALLTAI
jgi:hypothetical protein